MTNFFLDFMRTDRLGYISNLHLQAADQFLDGVKHAACLKLAEMASTAVDFSKTGVPVNLDELPRGFRYNVKPDFMAAAPRLITQTNIAVEDLPSDEDEEDDPVSALNPNSRRTQYYPSRKILGKLYRNIDETQFLRDIQQKQGTEPAGESLIKRIWAYVIRETKLIQWTHQIEHARQIRESYEESLLDTMHQYGPTPREPLTELEVLTGTILGKTGGLHKGKVKEDNVDMEDKADRNFRYHIDWILRDTPTEVDDLEDEYYDNDEEPDIAPAVNIAAYDDDDDEWYEEPALGGTNEALERSIACLYITIHDEAKVVPYIGKLRSFAYVAAAVCMQEVERFRELNSATWR